MTIIKQQSVTDAGHQAHLRNYINDDRKVLLRDSQNLDALSNPKHWAKAMSATRDAYGHNKAARRGKDGKPAKNTILYHQIIAFNPDEADINGGKLTPKDCMQYAKAYIAKYYPDQQVVFALHKEHCKADKTYRYAIHMVINRTNLSTGKRLDEGRSAQAKTARAKRIRAMDKAWGLKAVERDVRNSEIHKKQPSKTEHVIMDRGALPYKTNLRELCRLAAKRSEDIVAFREMLEGWGVDVTLKHGKLYVTDRDHAKYTFSVARLDADLPFVKLVKPVMDSGVAVAKADYLKAIRADYLAYRQATKQMAGLALEEIPKLKLKRPPVIVAEDREIRRVVLAYWRGADELREQVASMPRAKQQGLLGAGEAIEAKRQTESSRAREKTKGR